MERKIEQYEDSGSIKITPEDGDLYIEQERGHHVHTIIIQPDKLPQLITILQEFIGNEGKCYECKRDAALMQDYNGHNYLVCTSCLDKLNKEFDEEYR